MVTVTLEMDGGLLGTLAIGRIGAASHPDIGEIKLHILGSDGGLVISEATTSIVPRWYRPMRLVIGNCKSTIIMPFNAMHAPDADEGKLSARPLSPLSSTELNSFLSSRPPEE